MSATLLRRNCPSYFVTLQWKGGQISALCTHELLLVFLCGWGTNREREREFHVFLNIFLFLFLSIIIHLLWTQKYLCECGEGSGRTFIGWGDDTHWRSCWGTVDSMNWLLLSKRVNGVCASVHVCQPTSIVKKSSASSFFILVPLNDCPLYFKADLHMHGLVL